MTVVTTMITTVNDRPWSPRALAKYLPLALVSPSSFDSQPSRFAISARSCSGARRSACL